VRCSSSWPPARIRAPGEPESTAQHHYDGAAVSQETLLTKMTPCVLARASRTTIPAGLPPNTNLMVRPEDTRTQAAFAEIIRTASGLPAGAARSRFHCHSPDWDLHRELGKNS